MPCDVLSCSDDQASKSLTLCPIMLSSSTTARLVCFVLFLRLLTWKPRLGPAGRNVDPVFQHSRRHHVGFVRDLVKAGSVGFVEAAVEHVGLFFRCQEGIDGSEDLHQHDARASNQHFLRSSIWTVAHTVRGTLPRRISGNT